MESAAPRLLWPTTSLPSVFRAGCSTQEDRGFKQVYRNSQLTIHLYAYAAKIRIGEHTIDIQPGDLTLTPLGVAETFDFSKNGFHWFLRLTPGSALGDKPLSLDLHHRLGAHAAEARRRFETIATDLRAAGGQSEHPAAWAASASAQALLYWLAALAMPAPTLSAMEVAINKAITLLSTPECASLSIAEVARRVGMSQNRLAQAFLEQRGMTMSEYRSQRLIEVAKWLMESSTLSLPEIRRRLSLTDPQRFNKLFRRMTGMSPSAWLESRAPVTVSVPLPRVVTSS